MNSISRRRLGVLCGVTAALFLTGCARPKVIVHGRLTKGGQPLKVSAKGRIRVGFHPQPEPKDDPHYAAYVNPDGSFEVAGPERQGIPAGRYRVSVRQWDPYPRKDRLRDGFAPQGSPLLREVKSGAKELLIDLDHPDG